ncbi:hypothetical protein MKK84_14430 [Methylobacterium sp. E-065]|uniref:hypothetical protein n=1 Tax=Methylobacterium sp. E-065 TaxID=2836583 RepID=UPI001FBB87F4|nr:hypothetical protein [Methylobacterium sp. E-065]MCJ2018619.1 hypothetical protein [Methylobacterium sp. E-065]
MLKALRALITMATAANVPLEDIERGLPQAEAELTAARDAAEAAERQYRGSLLSGDEARTRQLDAARREAQIRLDRATALTEALAERHREAEEIAADERARAEKADRVQRYQDAARQAEEARELLSVHYPQLAGDIVAVLRAVAEAEVAVMSVNRDLPEGAEPLEPVERTVRNPARAGRRLISAEDVVRYCRPGEPLPKVDQSRVVVNRDGGASIQPEFGSIERLVPRRYREERYEVPLPTVPLLDLATAVKLPGLLLNAPDILDITALTLPHEVAEILTRAAEQPVTVPPQVKVELVLLDEVDAEAEFKKFRSPTALDIIAGRA